jgi:hypothetical protein
MCWSVTPTRHPTRINLTLGVEKCFSEANCGTVLRIDIIKAMPLV